MIYTKFILNLIQINISEDISLTVLLLFLMPKCFSKTPFIVPYHIRYKRKMTWKPAMEGKRIKGEKSEMTTMFPTKRTVFILLTWDRKYKDASCGLFFPFKTSGNKTGSWGKWKFFPYCVERPVEYPNGCLLEAGFMFHTQARRYVFRSYQCLGGTWSQKPGTQINLPGSVCIVRRCSRT